MNLIILITFFSIFCSARKGRFSIWCTQEDARNQHYWANHGSKNFHLNFVDVPGRGIMPRSKDFRSYGRTNLKKGLKKCARRRLNRLNRFLKSIIKVNRAHWRQKVVSYSAPFSGHHFEIPTTTLNIGTIRKYSPSLKIDTFCVCSNFKNVSIFGVAIFDCMY